MADIYDLAQSINRRRQQASQGYASGWEDLPVQVMKMLEARDEKKSQRDASSMIAIAGDYSNVFDNDELDARISKLDRRYGGDNYERLSADAMIQYDNTKELLMQQRRENADFDGQYNYLNNIQDNMDSWLGSLPEDGNISEDKAEEFKSLIKEFASSRGELERKHGGRLNTSNYNTFRSNMDAITNIGIITSNQFMKDGKMSSRESDAFVNSLMTYSKKPIDDYNTERRTMALNERNDLLGSIKKDMNLYGQLVDDYKRGGTYDKNNEFIPFDNDVVKELKLADIDAIEMRMKNKNKKYIELGGESNYLETQGFKFKKFKIPSTETEEEKLKGLAKEEKLRLADLNNKDDDSKRIEDKEGKEDKGLLDSFKSFFDNKDDKKSIEINANDFNEIALSVHKGVDDSPENYKTFRNIKNYIPKEVKKSIRQKYGNTVLSKFSDWASRLYSIKQKDGVDSDKYKKTQESMDKWINSIEPLDKDVKIRAFPKGAQSGYSL